jgi:hypothetical protein
VDQIRVIVNRAFSRNEILREILTNEEIEEINQRKEETNESQTQEP